MMARHQSDEGVEKRVVLDQVAPHDRIGEGAVGQLLREPVARRFSPTSALPARAATR
jgi:hypothetical protein